MGENGATLKISAAHLSAAPWLAVLALLQATPALAQDPAPAGPPAAALAPRTGDQLTIGFGLGIAPDYEGSNDYRLQPGGVMQGRVAGIDFQMRGLNLYTDFVPDQADSKVRVILGPVLQLRPERTGEDMDPRVAQLGDRQTAFEVGVNAGISFRGVLIPPASLTMDLTYLRDVTGAHDSYTLTPAISLSSPLSMKSFARLALSADYVGKGFARTYYDVGPGNALAPYATNGGGWKSASATLLYIRDFGGDPREGLGLFTLTSYKRMLGKFADSPVVKDAGSAHQALVVAGLLYGF
jgi:outer membrane scaffolding protein for murein synthesis (MipA/OmpV family)